jgi:hypothetical protein
MRDPRMIFGFVWIVLTAVLTLTIAIGHVEEKTSFGMGVLVTGWIVVGERWGKWAFETVAHPSAVPEPKAGPDSKGNEATYADAGVTARHSPRAE